MSACLRGGNSDAGLQRSFRAWSCRAEKTVDGMCQRGLDVKRVEHALAVVTTTHPVAVRHVKNNMAPALLPSHSHFAVHELHRATFENSSSKNGGRFSPYSRFGTHARERGQCRVVSQKRT